MENQSQSAGGKFGYVVLTLELLLVAGGAGWYFLYQKPAEPQLRPAFEAVACAGGSPVGWNLVTRHASGRDVTKLSIEEGGSPEDAMIGDVVDRWGDYWPEGGQFILSAPEDPKLKPLVSSVRVTSDKGEIRALKFGPGVWMEGRGDAAQKPFPLELSPDQPGLAIFQIVRCQVEPNRTLTTVRLSNQGSGKPWASIRARPDGSFEALVGPEAKSLVAPGRVGSFCVVSLIWNPKFGVYRFAVRPEGGFVRQAKETKFSVPVLEAADQMHLGDKLGAGGSSNGTMEVVETLVYRRELATDGIIKVEDWLYNYYFSSFVARGPFEWEAASPTASWGDEASWSGEGIPTANEEVKFTKVAKAEPIIVKLDGNRQIKKLSFSNASPSWTLAEGSFPGARLNITDGDATGSENIDALAAVDGTTLNLQVAMGGFSGSANDELTFLGNGGTVNFHKQIAARLNLGSSTSASRGMTYSLEAPNLIVTRFHAGFHDNPADAPVNGTVSTFVRVNQSQTTTADQIRVAGGGGSQFGVLTIQNKATWNQEKGAIYIGYSGSNGIDKRSNGRIEIGHPSSVGNLTIGNDVGLEIGEGGGTGVIDVHNGTLTVKASNDTQTVLLGDRGGDQASGGGNGTLNLNASGTILTARNFTRQVALASGSGTFNFNGGLLRLNRATGNVTKDLIGSGITVTLSGPGARIDTNGHNTVLARDLSGSGGMEKLGKGTLTLTGKNSYKGETKVTAGILTVSGPALPVNGTLQVNGGQVSLNGAVKVAKLVFAGAPQAAGTWGATGSGAKNIDDTRFAGTGVLTVGGG